MRRWIECVGPERSGRTAWIDIDSIREVWFYNTNDEFQVFGQNGEGEDGISFLRVFPTEAEAREWVLTTFGMEKPPLPDFETIMREPPGPEEPGVKSPPPAEGPTCRHGYIGPCAECDGSGQVPEED